MSNITVDWIYYDEGTPKLNLQMEFGFGTDGLGFLLLNHILNTNTNDEICIIFYAWLYWIMMLDMNFYFYVVFTFVILN